MREEDITEIVTEEEAKAGGGFFRTSRGALRCARCRSCLNRQMKRRCDMIITSSSTGATPKPKRAHASSKPDANDANGADADGDDAPHKAFAVWQRRTLFAAGADMTAIKTLGRWSSDIYQLYVRACRERCIEWTRKAGSQRFTDVDVTVDEVADY